MSHARCSRCYRTMFIQQQGEKKLLILNPKAHSFNTTNISYISTYSDKIPEIFGFLENQSLTLSRSNCVGVLTFVVDSLIVKPERVALSKR